MWLKIRVKTSFSLLKVKGGTEEAQSCGSVQPEQNFSTFLAMPISHLNTVPFDGSESHAIYALLPLPQFHLQYPGAHTWTRKSEVEKQGKDMLISGAELNFLPRCCMPQTEDQRAGGQP